MKMLFKKFVTTLSEKLMKPLTRRIIERILLMGETSFFWFLSPVNSRHPAKLEKEVNSGIKSEKYCNLKLHKIFFYPAPFICNPAFTYCTIFTFLAHCGTPKRTHSTHTHRTSARIVGTSTSQAPHTSFQPLLLSNSRI